MITPAHIRGLLLLATALAAVCAPPAAAQGEHKLTFDGLAGPVRRVREYDVAAAEERGGRGVKGRRRLDSVETYDRRRNLLTYTVYKDDGRLLWKDTYTYDEKGRVAEKRVRRDEHVYLADLKRYVYDARGRLREERGFDAAGKHLGGFLYEYDGRGHNVERRTYQIGSGHFFGNGLTRYTYDDQGRVLTEATYVYDDGEVRPDERGMGYHKKLYSYDEAGRVAKTVFTRLDGKTAFVETEKYDRRGETTESVRLDPSGRVLRRVSYSYVFDRMGNWVRQTRREWLAEGQGSVFAPVETSYRLIDYYPRARTGRPRAAASHAR